MKLRFNCECVDKYTNQKYRRGCVYEFDEDRAKEILATKRADEVKEPQVKASDDKKDDRSLDQRLDDGEMVNLHELKKAELVKLAEEAGVSTSGTKQDIIDRLLECAEQR